MYPPAQSYHVAWYVDGQAVHRDVTIHIADGRLRRIEAGCAMDAIELGEIALIPGLVNAHTHLEFSLLSEPIPTTGRFTDWIRAVVKYRREHAADTSAAIRQGIAESVRSGTTLIGDIATVGWSAGDYEASGMSGVVFQELIGLGDERVAQQCELAHTIAAMPPINSPGGSTEFGISPHAPYSVHPELLSESLLVAAKTSRPVAMHLAETPAELELLAQGTGEFRGMLTEFGIWRDGLFGNRAPINDLIQLASCPRALAIHGNYLSETELHFLATQPQLTLVYCPRTHAAFGHPEHPWQRVLKLGGKVAIGTDSRASNPDLSVFAELQFLAERYPEISHLELLHLGSHAGREVLLGETADLNRADFCAVQWNPELNPDPVRNLFSPGNQVVGTMIGGAWRFATDSLPVPDILAKQ